jgi:hypothetical protein
VRAIIGSDLLRSGAVSDTADDFLGIKQDDPVVKDRVRLVKDDPAASSISESCSCLEKVNDPASISESCLEKVRRCPTRSGVSTSSSSSSRSCFLLVAVVAAVAVPYDALLPIVPNRVVRSSDMLLLTVCGYVASLLLQFCDTDSELTTLIAL